MVESRPMNYWNIVERKQSIEVLSLRFQNLSEKLLIFYMVVARYLLEKIRA